MVPIIKFSEKDNRVELIRPGSDGTPMATMSETEFALFLERVYSFVGRNMPKENQDTPLKLAMRNAYRKEAWVWVSRVVKEKVKGYFTKK